MSAVISTTRARAQRERGWCFSGASHMPDTTVAAGLLIGVDTGGTFTT
jgi:hypothetical protein